MYVRNDNNPFALSSVSFVRSTALLTFAKSSLLKVSLSLLCLVSTQGRPTTKSESECVQNVGSTDTPTEDVVVVHKELLFFRFFLTWGPPAWYEDAADVEGDDCDLGLEAPNKVSFCI